MRTMSRKIFHIAGLILISLVLTLLEQNCANPSLFSKNESSEGKSGGGGSDGGFDGKTYTTSGSCGGTTGIKMRIGISADKSKAAILKDNCADLANPISISPSDIDVSQESHGVVVFSGSLFDSEQQPVNATVKTLVFCNGGDYEMAIWSPVSDPTSIFGQVNRIGILTTGVMHVAYRSYSAAGIDGEEYKAGDPPTSANSIYLQIEHIPVVGTQYALWYQANGSGYGKLQVSCYVQGQ